MDAKRKDRNRAEPIRNHHPTVTSPGVADHDAINITTTTTAGTQPYGLFAIAIDIDDHLISTSVGEGRFSRYGQCSSTHTAVGRLAAATCLRCLPCRDNRQIEARWPHRGRRWGDGEEIPTGWEGR